MLQISVTGTEEQWVHTRLRWLGVMAAILFRLGVGLWLYSGAGKAPMFGDYEAQRHWMEVTYWTPVGEWWVPLGTMCFHLCRRVPVEVMGISP